MPPMGSCTNSLDAAGAEISGGLSLNTTLNQSMGSTFRNASTHSENLT
jgi:hypothetical protein